MIKKTIQIMACTLGLAFLIGFNSNAKEPAEEYITYIEGVCETYNINPYLVQSLIFYESSWQTGAVSSSGTHVGLMQISLGHKTRMKELGVTDLTNAYQNILVGVDLLSDLRDEYQDPCKVLDAYNGCLHSDEWYEAGNMTAYSKKVLKLAEELETN